MSSKESDIWNKKHSFTSNIVFMLKKHWIFDKKFLLFPILKIPVNTIASLVSLFIPKIILDAVTSSKDISKTIIEITIFSLILLFLNSTNTYLSNQTSICANKFFLLNNFLELAQKKMTINYELFSSFDGKIASKKALTAIEGNIQVGITSFYIHLCNLLMNLGGFLSFVFIIATINPIIIFFLLVSYLFDGILAICIENAIHKSKHLREKIERKSLYITHKTCSGFFAKDIRIYTLSNLISEIKQELIKDGVLLQKKLHNKRFLQMIFEGLLIFFRDGATYIYLIYLLLNKETISLGSFSVYLAAISGFGNWLSSIVNCISMLTNANNSVSDYRNFIEVEADKKTFDKHIFSKAAPEIKLKDVNYSYDNQNPVLTNINLTIKPGEKIAIVGSNGSGKTTLIKLICGLITPTSGKIFYNGIDISTIPKDEYYSQISAVFQDINLLPTTIAENITFSTNPNTENLQQVLQKSDLNEIVERLPLGIHTKLLKQFNHEGIDLSGGETQKIILARALYKDSPLLILDEPTSALDPISEKNLYIKYSELAKDKTSIFISHRLSSTRFCDRIILLEKGNITENGTHEELMNFNGTYKSMFEISSKFYKLHEKGFIK